MNAWCERVFGDIFCCRLFSLHFSKIDAVLIIWLLLICLHDKSYVGIVTSMSQHAYEHVCEHNRLPTRFRNNMNTLLSDMMELT